MVDYLGQSVASLPRRCAVLLLPMHHFLTFVIRHQLAEVRCDQSSFIGPPRRLGRPRSVRFVMTIKEALLNPGNSIGQQPACSSRATSRLSLRLREGSDEIGAADNADHSATAKHRHAFYAVGGQQPC